MHTEETVKALFDEKMRLLEKAQSGGMFNVGVSMAADYVEEFEDLYEEINTAKMAANRAGDDDEYKRLGKVVYKTSDVYLREMRNKRSELLSCQLERQFEKERQEMQKEIEEYNHQFESSEYAEPEEEPKLSKKQKAGLLVGSAALGFFLGSRKTKRWSVFKK